MKLVKVAQLVWLVESVSFGKLGIFLTLEKFMKLVKLLQSNYLLTYLLTYLLSLPYLTLPYLTLPYLALLTYLLAYFVSY